MTQLDLSNRAAVSTRHLSYLETGRSRPSREMIDHLAEELDVPLRERNPLLAAAGFAPNVGETPLEGDRMRPARDAIERVLTAHEPNPALVVDHSWNLVLMNEAAGLFAELLPPELLEPPINVIRVSLHPEGFARVMANFDEYAAHLVTRLRRQVDRSADPTLTALLAEVADYVAGMELDEPRPDEVLLPMRLEHGGTLLSLFSTITMFGAPRDVTLDELAIESFFPADEATARVLAERAG